jgi:hypothetical protein
VKITVIAGRHEKRLLELLKRPGNNICVWIVAAKLRYMKCHNVMEVYEK